MVRPIAQAISMEKFSHTDQSTKTAKLLHLKRFAIYSMLLHTYSYIYGINNFTTADEEIKIMSSVLEVFQEHYSKLMRALPMNDDYFIAELYAKRLLPNSIKVDIESLPNSAKRASKFLDDVIKPSLEKNDCTKFHTLLSLLRRNNDSTIKALADKIRSSLNETIRSLLNQASSDDKTSMYVHS